MAPIVAFIVKTVAKAAISYYAGKAVRDMARSGEACNSVMEAEHYCNAIDCEVKARKLQNLINTF